jgi:hypothetical protein
MFRIPFFIIAFLIFSCSSSAQEFRKIPNTVFQRGEKLTFRVSFHSGLTGNIPAATAVLEVTQENKPFNGRNTYHIIGTGRTKGIIEMFYKVYEQFESYVDEEAMFPWFFIRHTQENNYVKNDNVTFKHKDKVAVSKTAIVPVPENIQDVISAFYYARTLDLVDAKPGKEFKVSMFLDDTVYYSHLKFIGNETIKTKLGHFNCIKVKPQVVMGSVFNEQYPVTIWISDDKNKIPVLIETKLALGSARVELVSFSGLLNPITSFKVQ